MAPVLAALLVMTSLGGPFAGTSGAHSPFNPIQPTQWPGYGTMWWDHWWSEAFVVRDVGTVSCAAGTACVGLYDGDRFSIGVVYWTDSNCFLDGCGSMNVEMWQAGVEISGDGINNGATRDDARNHANAGGYYFPPFSHPTPAKNAAVFTYCKWVFVDVNGIATGCALNGEPGRVRTSQLANLHFMWAATSGDGTVRGSPRGDFFELTASPAGYPAPAVPNDRANYGRRCAAAGAICTLNIADYGSDKPWTFGASGPFSPDPVTLGTGSFTAHADDLTLPGRLLGFAFTRWYNSADNSAASALGPGWTHSFSWTLSDNTATVLVRRGDGRQDTFTRNPDGSYAAPPGVSDTLVKNVNGSFTLTAPTQVQFELSSVGQLTRIHEPAGNQLALAYTAGNLTAITDTVGRAITLGYDATGTRLTSLTDPLGRKTTYAYDGSGRLAIVTDKLGNTAGQVATQHQWKYAYDGATRHLTTITDPDGRVQVTNSYDGQGRVFQQRDGLGKLTTFAYSPGQTVLTDPRLHPTTYTFDSRLRELSEVDVVGGISYTLSYSYDACGNRNSVTDRRGNRTDYIFDPGCRGNLMQLQEPQLDPLTPRFTTAWQYDPKNNPILRTDAKGFTTSWTYDAATNVKLSETRQIDATTSATMKWLYGDITNPGLPTQVVTPRGNTTATPDLTYSTLFGYDPQGNLTSSIDADGSTTTFAYDGLGRRTSMVDPDGNATGGVPSQHTWTTDYDPLDRVTAQTNPLGKAVRQGYDGASNRTTLTDRNGNVTTSIFDAAPRLWKVQQQPDPLGQPTLVYTTTITRDDNGNPTSVQQANGVITDYGFDELNRLKSMTTHPATGTNLVTSYGLDGNGNITTRTTADGVATTYQYDPLNRLTQVAATGLATITYGYNELSQRITMSDASGASSYGYDRLGRLTQAVQPNGTLGYGYDLDSNRTTLTYPGPVSVTSGYSNAGRLATVTDGPRLSSYTYTPAGLAKTVSVPGGMTTTYGHDTAQRLTSVRNAVGATTVSSHAYTLDDEGNRTALDEVVSGLTAGWSRVAGATLAANTAAPPTVTPASWNAGPLGAPVAAGDKLIAVVITSTSAPSAVSATGITDSLGNVWSRDLAPISFPDGLFNGELSIWSAVSAAGTPGNITAAFGTAFAAGDGLAVTVAAYRGLSTAAGAAGVDLAKIIAGTGAGPNAADSGTTTATTTAANELKLGIYADQGTIQPLDAGTLDTTYSTVVKQDANAAGETLIEDASSGPAGSTARATASLLGAGIPGWGMAVLVYKLSGSGVDHFTYSYDGLNRLMSASGPVAESFVLDGASNITSRTGPAQTDSYDQANRITSDGTQSYTWSNADRLTNRGADTFSYDPLDRLTISTVAGSARTYAYNGDGLLQSRTGAGAATFLWDPATSPSRELKQGGDNIVYGLGPLYVVKADATTLTLARDGSKNVRAEVNGAGAVSAAFRYRAYGQISQSTAAAPSYLGYAGQLVDPSGLVYMRARWYDPVMGRFLSHDPLSGAAEMPVTLNPYGYASANPNLHTDASGMCVPPATVACVVLIPVVAPEVIVWATGIITFAAVGTGAVLLATSDQNKPSSNPSDAGNMPNPNPNWDDGDQRSSWGRPETLARHFQEHGADFGATTQQEYADLAASFRQEALSGRVLTKIDADGVMRAYDPNTNTFGSYNANGTIRTFFKPDPAIHDFETNWDYWLSQPGSAP